MRHERNGALVCLIIIAIAVTIFFVAPVQQLPIHVVMCCCFGVAILGIVFVLVAYAYTNKLVGKAFEPVWSPLDESKISDVFKRYIAKNTLATEELGYVSVGLHLVKETPLLRNEAACLLHPHGHSLIQLVRCGEQMSIEILSFLEEGSVICSSNVSVNAESLFSKMESLGFSVSLSPGATVKMMIEDHNRSLQAVLSDPHIRLRRLNVQDWRQYALYSSRRFMQIQFELGMLNNSPEPFSFPSGNLVNEDEVKSMDAQNLQQQPV